MAPCTPSEKNRFFYLIGTNLWAAMAKATFGVPDLRARASMSERARVFPSALWLAWKTLNISIPQLAAHAALVAATTDQRDPAFQRRKRPADSSRHGRQLMSGSISRTISQRGRTWAWCSLTTVARPSPIQIRRMRRAVFLQGIHSLERSGIIGRHGIRGRLVRH